MWRGDRLRQAQGGVAHQAGVGGGVGGSGVVQLVPGHTAQGRDAGGGLLQPGGEVMVLKKTLLPKNSNSSFTLTARTTFVILTPLRGALHIRFHMM